MFRTAIKKVKKKIYFEPLEDHHQRKEVVNWASAKLDVDYLEKAIKQLPEGYRTVFVLVEVEGYGHKEIAGMLDISEGTSKSQLFHAKKKLRNILESYELK